MKPVISIVVPVYNVEAYIRRCLDSIINQSMKEFEVLVVDDGSTDNSGKICDEYALKDLRIKVYHQKNGGIARARNFGLKKARGKYIMFIDSDDYVEKDFCLVPYGLAEKNNADIVIFNHWHVDLQGNKIQRKKAKIDDGSVDKGLAINLITEFVTVVVWNKLYKKELFDNVVFPDGFLYEDNAVTYKLILLSKKIYYTNQELYFHCCREGSVSSTLNHQDFIEMYYVMYNELRNLKYPFKVSVDILLVSLRYLTYYGLNSKYSKKCIEILDGFNNYSEVNLETRILLFIYKTNKTLFNFVCFLFCKRHHPERF